MRPIRTGSLVVSLLILAPQARAQTSLTIVPTFDGSIAADPNAATIEATINQVIALYQTRLTTQAPTTVNITFGKDTTISLGQSSTFFGTVSYSQYRAALASHAATAADTTALANLPTGPAVTINGRSFTSVDVTTANLRALGFTANVASDSTVSLNTSIMNLSRAGPRDPARFDLFAVAAHEIDEALGLGSNVGSLNGANGRLRPEDLFRFDQNGARSFTSSSTALSFFSLDGRTRLAQFNQDARGDFGDWFSPAGHTPVQVQDAFATAGAAPDPGVELTGLDAIGFDLVPAPVPEPGSLATLGAVAAVAGLGRVRRRRVFGW
jgi:hypothetical protein